MNIDQHELCSARINEASSNTFCNNYDSGIESEEAPIEQLPDKELTEKIAVQVSSSVVVMCLVMV